MRSNVETMVRAGLALQTAALKFGDDNTDTQAEARQAIIEMRDAMNDMHATLASMNRACEDRRHGKISSHL